MAQGKRNVGGVSPQAGQRCQRSLKRRSEVAAMPITVTLDVSRPTSAELHRIRGFFERLGWEHLGNTAYRYPKLDTQHAPEDWFNHVIPALMLLRTFARHAAATGRNIHSFSIDVQSSTGFNPNTNAGTQPL